MLAAETSEETTWESLMDVDPKKLDADAEMRRIFGSRVVSFSAICSFEQDEVADLLALYVHRSTPSHNNPEQEEKPKKLFSPDLMTHGLAGSDQALPWTFCRQTSRTKCTSNSYTASPTMTCNADSWTAHKPTTQGLFRGCSA